MSAEYARMRASIITADARELTARNHQSLPNVLWGAFPKGTDKALRLLGPRAFETCILLPALDTLFSFSLHLFFAQTARPYFTLEDGEIDEAGAVVGLFVTNNHVPPKGNRIYEPYCTMLWAYSFSHNGILEMKCCVGRVLSKDRCGN